MARGFLARLIQVKGGQDVSAGNINRYIIKQTVNLAHFGSVDLWGDIDWVVRDGQGPRGRSFDEFNGW
jgi:hypothetical protein